MPITTKIRNFDNLFIPSTPLSEDVALEVLFVKRNQLETNLQISTSSAYVYSEPVLVARLYDNEINRVTEIVQSKIPENATYTFIVDTADTTRTSYLFTITSESGKTTSKYRVVTESLGTSPTNLEVHKVVNENDANAKPRYFDYQDVTVNSTTLKIGIIEVPSFNNASEYFNISIKTSDNSSVLTYVSKNGNEPDSLNTHSTTLVAFDANEDVVLDDAFVYAKITDGTDTYYFKLIQSTSLASQSDLDSLKEKMSNKWYHIFDNVTAVQIGHLTASQLIAANDTANNTALKTYLDNNTIKYVELGSHLPSLIDTSATESLLIDGALAAYNNSNIDVFTQSDIDDLGKSLATSILVNIDALAEEPSEHIRTWLEYVSTRDSKKIVSSTLSASMQSAAIQKAKSDFIKNFATTAFVYKTINSRYLEHMLRKIDYVRLRVKNKTLVYKASVSQLESSSLAIRNIANAHKQTASFDSLTETALKEFANALDLMIVDENVIQKIKW